VLPFSQWFFLTLSATHLGGILVQAARTAILIHGGDWRPVLTLERASLASSGDRKLEATNHHCKKCVRLDRRQQLQLATFA